MAASPLLTALRTLGRKETEVKNVKYSTDGRLAEIEFFPPGPVVEKRLAERLGAKRPEDNIEAADLMGQEFAS